MDKLLKHLFDFQKFDGNPRLSEIIAAAENRCHALSDDELEAVSAAGDPTPSRDRKDGENG